MLLTTYQKTEIILGTIFFPLLFSLYYYVLNKPYSYYMTVDILWCTFVIFIILLIKNFYINFRLLQSQNFISIR